MHGGVLVNGVLYLGAIHVFACAQNHVFGAIFDVEEALVIHAADVARAQPAVDDGFGSGFRLVPVAANEHRAKHPNFARLARRKCRTVVVANFYQHRWRTTARAGGVRHIVVTTVAGAKRIGFGHAIAELRPAFFETVGHLVHQRGWCGCATTTHRTQRRRVELGKVGVVDEVPTLGGHTDEVGDFFTLDNFERLAGIPLVHNHQFEARHKTTHQHRNTTRYVKQRHNQNERRRKRIRLGLCCRAHTFNCLSCRKRHQRTNHRAMR